MKKHFINLFTLKFILEIIIGILFLYFLTLKN